MAAEKDTLAELNAAVDAIENRYHTKGSVTNKPVKITLEDDSTLTFPMSLSQVTENMPAILKNAKTSAFGKGAETIIDPAVRTAFEIVPQNFKLDFDVADTGILTEIKNILVPDATAVTAELHKLNIYTKGGHFEKHKDTPRGETSFGSLVVLLPAPFAGGMFGMSYNDDKKGLNWANTYSYSYGVSGSRWGKPSDWELKKVPSDTLQWVAFFGDVDHWVNKVTEGARFTLTYILYRDAAPDPSCDQLLCRATQLQKVLETALKSPTFFPEGGAIGYYCGHLYEENQLKASEKKLNGPNVSATQLQLKNHDAVFAVVGSSLGLNVEVIRLLTDEHYYLNDKYILKQLPATGKKPVGFGKRGRVTEEYIDEYKHTDCQLNERYDKLEWIGSKGEVRRMFCTKEFSGTGYFGNEASQEDFYTSAAVVISIPEFASRCDLSSTQLSKSRLVVGVDQPKTSSKLPKGRQTTLQELTNRIGVVEKGSKKQKTTE